MSDNMIDEWLKNNKPTVCDDITEDEIYLRDTIAIAPNGKIKGRTSTASSRKAIIKTARKLKKVIANHPPDAEQTGTNSTLQ
jgi:hypothetical protein